MIYRRTERFRKAFKALPRAVQEKVVKAFALFQQDQRHPSLLIKKMQGRAGIWEGRIDQDYRFTYHYEKGRFPDEIVCVFRNVDSHDECLKNP